MTTLATLRTKATARSIPAWQADLAYLQCDGRLRRRYVIRTFAGAGGMAQVYRAETRDRGTPVALKVLSPGMADAAFGRELMRQEAYALAVSAVPGVVELREYGETSDGRPYLALEWLEGRNLRDELVVHGALPLPRVAELMDELLVALAEIHARGVVHGDVKPENLVLEPRRAGPPRLTLIDFGVARVSDGPQLDPSRGVCGTPGYMAPELMHGAPPSPASDLYAAGATLIELLTGQPAFEGGSASAVTRAQLTEPPPSACRVRRGLRPTIDAVVSRALATEPAERFASASEMADALTAALRLPTPDAPGAP